MFFLMLKVFYNDSTKFFPEDTHLNEFHSCPRIRGSLALLIDTLELLYLLMVVVKLLSPIPGENLSLTAFKQLWNNTLKPVQGKNKNNVK